MTRPKCSPDTCIPAIKQAKRLKRPSSKLKAAIRIYYEDEGKPINRLYRVSVAFAAKFDELVKAQGWKEGMD